MSKTRNNHYVPRWYQEGFFEADSKTLAYIDMQPPRKTLADGRIIVEKSKFDAPTSRAFREWDLYSTFFGTSVNDEIERRLFGAIDSKGANAIRAFMGTNEAEWHQHFETFFAYIDIQKIRTPKGLDWLKAQYPNLAQNELMYEMQGIRMIHCTIWTEGVREIVSAEDADVKFIISDHPVTIYNYAVRPAAKMCAYPNEPSIALKASQTIFPLNRDFCLVLTNLEYAKDPSVKPLEKRTFARNYRNSMVRTDAFIRTRKLTNQEVVRFNYILKTRARRYMAAGREEWLYPEESVTDSWEQLRETFLPPEDQLWHFGGEMYVKYNDGRVHYQDEFGRTEKEREFLKKPSPRHELRAGDACGCGSGNAYKVCCKSKPIALRPTWSELSIRERNILLLNAIVNVLGLREGRDWVRVRRELTDEQIREIYYLYEGLWPRETDLLQLLPKPDGSARAIYTGSVHPTTVYEFALGASLYFGELLIQNPFIHAGTMKKEFSPVENPKAYRQEFLKTIHFFLNIMPLVADGVVNLIPDPCDFDDHLRGQMFEMVKARAPTVRVDERQKARLMELAKEDFKRSMMSLPREAMRAQILKVSPELDEAGIEELLAGFEQLREADPLAVLQPGSLTEGGQFNAMKLIPNFEITMYLAQATGACIVTDSPFRWNEIRGAIRHTIIGPDFALTGLSQDIASSEFAFPQDVADIAALASDKTLSVYPELMRDIFKYLSKLGERGVKPNWEAHVRALFARVHAPAQATINKANIPATNGRISCAFPAGGIQDNTVNRLLLMSSSEWHLPSVPMAFLMESGSSATPAAGPFLPLAD